MRPKGVLIALLAVAIASGCVAACGGDSSTSGGQAASAGSDCGLPPYTGDPGSTAFGRVHFFGYAEPGWRQGDRLQIVHEGGRRWSAKQAIEIATEDPVVLSVPPEARRTVDLVGWGDANASGEGHDRIELEPPATDDCRQSWPGGFTFTRKQCLTLTVRADSRSTSVPFGLGRSC